MTTLTGYNYKTLIPVRFADLNACGHVDNATYLTYFEIARNSYWKDVLNWKWKDLAIVIGKVEVTYLKPLKEDDQIFIYVRTSRVGNRSFDLDYALVRMKNGKEELCTLATTVCVCYDSKNDCTALIPEMPKSKMQEFELIEA